MAAFATAAPIKAVSDSPSLVERTMARRVNAVTPMSGGAKLAESELLTTARGTFWVCRICGSLSPAYRPDTVTMLDTRPCPACSGRGSS